MNMNEYTLVLDCYPKGYSITTIDVGDFESEYYDVYFKGKKLDNCIKIVLVNKPEPKINWRERLSI